MITHCPRCGQGYEEQSREEADNPERCCGPCWLAAIAAQSRTLPKPTAREYLLADIRDGWEKDDETIAARALEADLATGIRLHPDNSRILRADLTDPTVDRLCEAEIYERLARALRDGKAGHEQFGRWFCHWFAQDCAATLRRLAAPEGVSQL